MSDELRVAANLICSMWKRLPTGVRPTDLFFAAMKLADAYLADHPADDDEQITVDWVESIAPKYWEAGEEYYWPKVGLRYATKIGNNGSAETDMWYFDKQTINGKPIPLPIKTRRDVRRLIAALGIEMPK